MSLTATEVAKIKRAIEWSLSESSARAEFGGNGYSLPDPDGLPGNSSIWVADIIARDLIEQGVDSIACKGEMRLRQQADAALALAAEREKKSQQDSLIAAARVAGQKVTLKIEALNIEARKHGAPFVCTFDERGDRTFVEPVHREFGRRTVSVWWKFEALPGDLIQARRSDGSWKNDSKAYFRVMPDGTLQKISDTEAGRELATRKMEVR